MLWHMSFATTAPGRSADHIVKQMREHICEPIQSTGRILPGEPGITMCAGNTFNYPQFRPLRWLPIPDPSNEIAPSTSRHCLELDLLPDSDNHLVLRSSSGSAQVFWLEAAFCSCLSQNGQATLSQDRSMQFSATNSDYLGSSSSTRKPASSGCKTPISGSQDAPQFEASTLLRDNLTLVSCGTFKFSTSWRTNRAFQRRPESIGQANR